jgi:hypothetical protein
VVDVQSRFRDEQVHQPGVGQRDDRVVVSGQDEHRLAQSRQQRQAAPARAGEELIQVPGRRPDPVTVVHRGRDQPGIIARRTPVDVPGHPLQVATVQVPPRRHHVHEHRRLAGDRRHAGRGGDEHQPPAAGALGRGELLRDAAAPGDAKHIDLAVAELGQHARDQPTQPSEAVGSRRRRRAADARRIEPDHLDGRVNVADERLEHLQAGADAVDQQQRRAARGARPAAPEQPAPGRPHGNPQLPAADGDAAHLSGRGHRFQARRCAPGMPCGRASAGSCAPRRRARPATTSSPSTSCPARSPPRPGTRAGRPG